MKCCPMMRVARSTPVWVKCTAFGRKARISGQPSFSFATSQLRKAKEFSRFTPIYERSSPREVFQNWKSSLFTKRTPKLRSRSFSKRYERAKSVSSSALLQRWEPGQMCRIKSLLPTILIALGVRQIWSSGQEERSDRATKIRRYTFTVMLQKIPLTHICISLWRENRSLQVR